MTPDRGKLLRLMHGLVRVALRWRAHDRAGHPAASRDLDRVRDALDAIDAWASPHLPPDLEQLTGDPAGRGLYPAADAGERGE
jgi:hypothetical protein